MKRTFFARHALLVLVVVFFLVPFALRGARMSLQRMRNDVKDWLPSHFPETKELAWFARHFVGEQFIVVTWPGCTEEDPRFHLMVRKLQAETAPHYGAPVQRQAAAGADAGGPEPGAAAPNGTPGDPEARGGAAPRAAAATPDPRAWEVRERERARELGDRLGLFATGDYHLNWGGRNEKWLLGDHGVWYFITPRGGLYRWTSDGNVLGYLRRWVEKALGMPLRNAELVAVVGRWENNEDGEGENEFYRDPRKLTGRLFNSVRTGPMILEQLAAPGGPLWPMGDVAEEDKPRLARQAAMDRLTGTLFGPAVPYGFRWTVEEFRRFVPEKHLRELPEDWPAVFARFVEQLVRDEYGGDRERLAKAPVEDQARHWRALFERFGCEPPPRQTCIIVTLSDVGKRNFHRSVGRPILGKPPGRLYQLAQNECGIAPADLKLGGPPVDNVAIDEEGTKTLFELIVYSAVVGLGLAYLCFRSAWVTIMIFFVGGVSAVASLAIVWWAGSTVDAIVMSMPALVYVLGLSGAVHIVNYYREAVREGGLAGAPERALAHGWFPCTLAAFTTSLGLMSLCTSHITPIRRFGVFSALGVMATVVLLFTYLPAALQLYPPGFDKQRAGRGGEALQAALKAFWGRLARFVIRRHAWVVGCFLLVIGVFAAGLARINTSIDLLELLDPKSKLIQDYAWLERHLGKLVPMELVLCVDKEAQRPPLEELGRDRWRELQQLDFLERMEAASRVRRLVEDVFGQRGRDVIGKGIAADTFAPPLPDAEGGGMTRLAGYQRRTFNAKLEKSRPELLRSDYLRIDERDGSELWRISLRLGALNDVDYGQFVGELKQVVEPVLAAYRCRDRILDELIRRRPQQGFLHSSVLLLGYDPDRRAAPAEVDDAAAGRDGQAPPEVDQTRLFAETLDQLLQNRMFRRGKRYQTRMEWLDPEAPPEPEAEGAGPLDESESFDCVVLVRDVPQTVLRTFCKPATLLIDARDHVYDPRSPNAKTAAQRRREGDPYVRLHAVYTGIVPIVYKAQRALLESLIKSIALAFVMISVVMMILLRRWRDPLRWSNMVNVSGGLVSMLPNVFPMVLVFGAMGHLGVMVDVGTMMTASVAMGVAVDDTIHYLNWFREGLNRGLDRRDAIRMAYDRCATAMTQTTAIGGLGLFVFALSTFTPTQRFGVLMLTLLITALLGDLVMLPALLAGPLGKYFEPRRRRAARGANQPAPETAEQAEAGSAGEQPAGDAAPGREAAAPAIVRYDPNRRFGT